VRKRELLDHERRQLGAAEVDETAGRDGGGSGGEEGEKKDSKDTHGVE
jgi:hypothetical protein